MTRCNYNPWSYNDSVWMTDFARILSRPRVSQIPEPEPVPRLAAARRRAMMRPTPAVPTPIVPEWMWQPPTDPRGRVPRQNQNRDQALDSTEASASKGS